MLCLQILPILLIPQTWIESYGDYLYRYALMRVSNASVAEDLVPRDVPSWNKNR